jgi:hypothetical protein
MLRAMRYAVFVAVALVGCAHGNSSSAPDAGVDSTAPPAPDAMASCNGLPCSAVYVAPTGDDGAAGTRDAPVQTITAAIAIASAASPAEAVFVQAGSYAESIDMKAGVSIYGGFDATWTRADSAVTSITGASPAVTFHLITVPTSLDHVTIKSADGAGPGASSIGVLVQSSMKIELDSVTVLPGKGADGADGSDGTGGGGGTAGANGKPGMEHSSFPGCDEHTVPVGQPGGSSTCGRTGGTGGSPGVGDGGGIAGAGGTGGTSGGGGGASGKVGGSGGSGASGGAGAVGAGGLQAGTFASGMYVAANGGNGTSGGNGNGGGGGGGGGGGTTDCDSSGGSGAGGGGGGCGGTLGTGGGGGGGSFGVVAIDSTVTLKGATVTAAAGGNGGRGGTGGTGGTGGGGGIHATGNSDEQDDGGNGGDGGSGGSGGAGGSGGGGGGGPSAAVVCTGSATITIPQTTITGGIAGTAGPSAVNPGAPGLSTRSIGCSFF